MPIWKRDGFRDKADITALATADIKPIDVDPIKPIDVDVIKKVLPMKDRTCGKQISPER